MKYIFRTSARRSFPSCFKTIHIVTIPSNLTRFYCTGATIVPNPQLEDDSGSFTHMTPKIIVMGVGGAGGNTVENMIARDFQGVDFVVANTDAQALSFSSARKKVQIGKKTTLGLGAGAVPDKGKTAAEEALPELLSCLQDSHMLFLTAGMGGGTGTGAAPVIAKAAREKGILTVAVVTKPFAFEGSRRMRLAEKGIEELEDLVDTLIVIPNNKLLGAGVTTFADSFKMVNNVLFDSVKGMTDLIVNPGLINLDFADVHTTMKDKGRALMGTGLAEGKGRARLAAEAALHNPLLDSVAVEEGTGVLISICGGQDLTLMEVDEIANIVKDSVAEDAHIIFGASFDDSLEGMVRVSLIITGMGKRPTGTKEKKIEGKSTNASAESRPLNKLFDTAKAWW